jgi:4-hydroxy-2-oxoheptanedioate aldolase
MALYTEPGAYQQTANQECLALPMIETRDAVANLDAILDVEGIAGVYIGPSDLGFSHGLVPKLDRDEPEMLRIFDRVIEAATSRGLNAGIHCGTASYAARAIGMGFRLVTILNDSGLLAIAARAAVAQVRRESNGVA